MFHRPSFSPVSFSRISFNGAMQPVEQDGRSGYWRLFFTQLQEDSEKKPEVVAVTPEPKKKVKRIVKPPVVAKPEPDDDEPDEIPYAPIGKPTPQPEVPCYLADAWRATTEVRGWLLQHRINTVKYYLIREAANDEEDDIELLLLAA